MEFRSWDWYKEYNSKILSLAWILCWRKQLYWIYCYALSDTKTERLNEEIYNSNNFIGILAAYWRDYQYSELGWFWGYDITVSSNLTKPSRSKPKKPGFLTQNDWERIDGDSETKADLEKAINRPFVFFGIIGGYNF